MKSKIYVKTAEARKESSVSRKQRTDFSQSTNSPIDHILSLQRTIGNQAVQRLFKSGVIQAKLRIGQPNDIYEQEADRVAEQVMSMPEQPVERQPEEELQTKPLAGQITPLVQKQPIEEELQEKELSVQTPGATLNEELCRQPIEEEGEEEELLQTKEMSGEHAEITPDLESRINAIEGGGQPLPESERAFFELRFGRDFDQVRVHTDTWAAESARVLNAQAYTVGQDIVFGTGRYAVETANGLRLLAHELVHVAQQPETSARVIRREEEPTRQQIARDTHLRRLAVWPNEALYEWRQLNSGEQMVVVFYMTENYGHDFASQFLTYARRRRRPEPVAHWTNILTETRERLQRRGYRFVVTSMGIEHWVHPSGNTLHRILPSRRSEQQAAPPESTERRPPQEQPSLPAPQEETENPPRINPSADPEANYGPAVQSRDGAEIMGQSGRAVEHEDGTILLYPPGSRIPITYRPRPGGAYDYYGPDGVKAENVIIAIDPDEVFSASEGSSQ